MDVKKRLVRQTLGLSVSHFVVRVLGFVLRILLSRELGAASMGLVELAHSAQQLLITPVVMTRLSLTMTAPTFLRLQLAQPDTSRAISIKR